MRDFITAVALVWCLYNTWSLQHNFKQDRLSNSIDKLTTTVMVSYDKRISQLEKEMKASAQILMEEFEISSKLVDKIVEMEEKSCEGEVLEMGKESHKESWNE